MEIKNAVVVVVLIFLKHNDVRGRLADSNLFLRRGINTVHEFPCTRSAICVQVMCTVVTAYEICEGLWFLHTVQEWNELR